MYTLSTLETHWSTVDSTVYSTYLRYTQSSPKVHWRYTGCTLDVHWTYTEHPLYTVHTLYIHWSTQKIHQYTPYHTQYTVCTLNIHCTKNLRKYATASCTVEIHCTYTEYPLNIHWCTLYFHWVHCTPLYSTVEYVVEGKVYNVGGITGISGGMLVEELEFHLEC